MRMRFFAPIGPAGAAVARRVMVPTVIVTVVVSVAGVGLVFLPEVRAIMHDWPVFKIAIVLQFVGYYVACFWSGRRLQKAGYRKCLHCWAGLEGTQERGLCRGCGKDFDVASVRDEWENSLWSDRSRLVPGAVRRLRRYTILAVPLIAVFMAALVFGMGSRYFVYFVLPPCLIISGLVVTTHVLERRLIGRVRRAGYLVCPECEYPLSGAGERGTCPECGRAFDRVDLKRDWTRSLGWGEHDR